MCTERDKILGFLGEGTHYILYETSYKLGGLMREKLGEFNLFRTKFNDQSQSTTCSLSEVFMEMLEMYMVTRFKS